MFDPNQLYYDKLKWFTQNKGKGHTLIMCDEGGSRSAKTWSNIQLIDTYCDHNRGKRKDIGIFRDTLITCKDYTLKEFEKCYRVMGKKFSYTNTQKPFVDMYGNNIYFRGLADESEQEAAPFDLIYINEAIDIDSESMIAGLKMRCKDLIIFDWNPKYTDHWLFKYELHPNCLFTHSTIRDNKHAPIEVLNDLLACDPDNPINVKNGTVDEYRWKVYYLGMRATPEGVVFNDVTYVDKIPDEVDCVSYGLDFGQTNETAIVKTAIKLNEIKHDLYLQRLCYSPTPTVDEVIEIVKSLKINSHIWCDNNKPGWISDMRANGITAIATRKFDGSREYWIQTLKRFNIHIVKDHHFKREQENFKYMVIDGVQLSKTITKHDHLWSASGYSAVGDLRQYLND